MVPSPAMTIHRPGDFAIDLFNDSYSHDAHHKGDSCTRKQELLRRILIRRCRWNPNASMPCKFFKSSQMDRSKRPRSPPPGFGIHTRRIIPGR